MLHTLSVLPSSLSPVSSGDDFSLSKKRMNISGETNNRNYIEFIDVKFLSIGRGCFQAWVPAYIIGKANSLSFIPKPNAIKNISFKGECIDRFMTSKDTVSDNLDYNNSSFIWMDTIIKKIGKQKTSYCYNEKEDKSALSICSLNKDYTIRPNIITNKNPLKKIKESLSSGSIISMKINSETEEQLKLIINYINSKGYKIVNLEEHLKE